MAFPPAVSVHRSEHSIEQFIGSDESKRTKAFLKSLAQQVNIFAPQMCTAVLEPCDVHHGSHSSILWDCFVCTSASSHIILHLVFLLCMGGGSSHARTSPMKMMC
eukprot:1155740-Pelagomonas_calceolata.AAC.3